MIEPNVPQLKAVGYWNTKLSTLNKVNMGHETLNKQETTNSDLGAVSGSSFEHYMIYVNDIFELDIYSFAEVQDYYDRYKLYGKITYEKVV